MDETSDKKTFTYDFYFKKNMKGIFTRWFFNQTLSIKDPNLRSGSIYLYSCIMYYDL